MQNSLDKHSKQETCLETKALFIIESSVIEVLRNIFFKTLFSVSLYFSRLRVWKVNTK